MWWVLAGKAAKIGANAYKTHQAKKNGTPLDTNTTTRSAPLAPRPVRYKAYVELTLFFLQLVFGLTVIGLYGRDVHSAREHGDPQNAKWVYALVTGFLGAGTGLVYFGYGVVMMKLGRLERERRVVGSMGRVGWGVVLVVLWLVVFGVFGGMYIGVYGSGSEKEVERTKRMRRAVWVDLVNLVFWVGTTVIEGLRWWRLRSAGGVGDIEMLKGEPKGEGEAPKEAASV
ncbi:uncharacterized protein BDW43DRAFT_311524 [Aspergillus alliaceus]|uniref:uncharacterized protein n=1 Tax=Petromyces alliaceus TaxID=209559 RepID=UPI0012A3D0A0|nr:uncharacterized protein BDW43DRAFT_311524 [Aspergillus alliaceus]KAB8233117.1 hypothetical protein BDW43DRAFT_311524 [Aspergillus alliaceus]